MKYNLNFGAWGSVFAVPTRIIDEFINDASGVYIKILLLILRNQDNFNDTAQLAALVSISETDINEAVSYWIDKGVLSEFSENEEQNGGETVKIFKQEEETKSDPQKTQPNIDSTPPKVQAKGESHRVSQIPQAGSISAREIKQRLKTNSEVKFIMESSEQIFGRPITSTEVRHLLYIYDTMGLPADVIIMIVGYCEKIEKINIKYILKVCESWSEQGINTHEKAEVYLKKQLNKNKKEKEIRSLFGIDRNLSIKEQQYSETWVNEFGFKINVIHLAYEKTINSIGKLSFPYINKILSDWNSKGYKTLDDVTGGEDKVNPRSEARTSSGNLSFVKKIKGNAASYDIDAFEKLEFKVSSIKPRKSQLQ